jgi:acyl-CoA synthetase (AMP-forming)/AMP-acid ligase II
VLRGRNHAPQDVEHALDGVEGVRTGCCAAVGLVPADGDGEELAVFVERARDYPGASAELAERVRRRVLERTGLAPAQVHVLEAGTLPRTSSGKIRRNETRRAFLAGELVPPERVTWLRLVRELVRSRIAFGRAARV